MPKKTVGPISTSAQPSKHAQPVSALRLPAVQARTHVSQEWLWNDVRNHTSALATALTTAFRRLGLPEGWRCCHPHFRRSLFGAAKATARRSPMIARLNVTASLDPGPALKAIKQSPSLEGSAVAETAMTISGLHSFGAVTAREASFSCPWCGLGQCEL